MHGHVPNSLTIALATKRDEANTSPVQLSHQNVLSAVQSYESRIETIMGFRRVLAYHNREDKNCHFCHAFVLAEHGMA